VIKVKSINKKYFKEQLKVFSGAAYLSASFITERHPLGVALNDKRN
jgi:hypothetical protein